MVLGSLVTYLGLVLILVGGLRSEADHAGSLVLIGLLILGVITYPPPDARRGVQAVLVLAGVAVLLALWSLEEQIRAGRGAAQVMDDLLVLSGAAMALVDAARQPLHEQSGPRGAATWGRGRHRPTEVAEPVLWDDSPQEGAPEGAAPVVRPPEQGHHSFVTRAS